MQANVLDIRKIRVRDGRLDLEVAVGLSALHVSKKAAERMLSILPHIAKHVCKNETNSPRFGDELIGTQTPHLLEHTIIELQGQAYRGLGKSVRFMGHTSWLDELSCTRQQGYALMRVTVTFACDVACLQAVKEAAALVEWACAGDAGSEQKAVAENTDDTLRNTPPDTASALRRIRALA